MSPLIALTLLGVLSAAHGATLNHYTPYEGQYLGEGLADSVWKGEGLADSVYQDETVDTELPQEVVLAPRSAWTVRPSYGSSSSWGTVYRPVYPYGSGILSGNSVPVNAYLPNTLQNVLVNV